MILVRVSKEDLNMQKAILNLELVKHLDKPVGFYDPNNPALRGSDSARS